MDHHVRGMVAWVQAQASQRLLIHCHAGLGRSPALAIVALMAVGMEARDAVDTIVHAVLKASPNRLILRHAEVILG